MESKEDKQAIGAQIPDRVFQSINLYSQIRGLSKSQILRDSLLLWLDRNEVTMEELIAECRRQYEDEWRRVKNDGRSLLAKGQFIAEKKKELDQRKIDKSLQDKIFKSFEP